MDISERQEKILGIIDSHLKQFGYAPSLREISELLGEGTVSTILKEVETLTSKGFLYRVNGRQRAYMPVKSGFGQQEFVHISQISDFTLPSEKRIMERVMTVPGCLSGGNSFVYVMRGNFLVKKGIFDGDMLYFDEISGTDGDVNDGDIVAAVADGFPVVGVLSYDKGSIVIKPANDALENICPGECRIAGKMIFLQRFIPPLEQGI